MDFRGRPGEANPERRLRFEVLSFSRQRVLSRARSCLLIEGVAEPDRLAGDCRYIVFEYVAYLRNGLVPGIVRPIPPQLVARANPARSWQYNRRAG